MKKLSEILHDGDDERIRRAWQNADPAKDYGLLPAGEYVAEAISGELFKSRGNGTPGYKITLKVVEGLYAGRFLYADNWLTEAAMSRSRHELGKFGLNTPEQLEQPLPKDLLCKVKVVVEKDDDGTERNRVRNFEVIGVCKPKPDPFAPSNTVEAMEAWAKSQGLSSNIDAT